MPRSLTKDAQVPLSGDRKQGRDPEVPAGRAPGPASGFDLVGLATAGLGLSLAVVNLPSSNGGALSWGLWSLALVLLAVGLAFRSPWLLLLAYPSLCSAARVAPSIGSWTHPAMQAHPELTAAALVAFLGAGLIHCNERRNASMMGASQLAAGLSLLSVTAPALVAATVLLSMPRFLAHYGPDAVRAQTLALTLGLAALVAVFGLSVYAPWKAHGRARKAWTRRVLKAERRGRREVLLFLGEVLAGIALAGLAWALAR